MEKTRDAVVVPLDAGWSDVGSWAALHEASRPITHGNVTHGDVIAEDTHDCFLYSADPLGRDRRPRGSRRRGDQGRGAGRAQSTRAGREAARRSAEGAAAAASAPASRGVPALGQLRQHRCRRRAFRSSASRSSLAPRFRCRLHHHRAEHWVVVAGTARITRGDEMFLLEENQSTYIPLGTMHRIENPGTVPAAYHRGAVWQLSGRGRHRALRGSIWP